MSAIQHLKEFISERLHAAAEEIFTEFEKTIVQYEEEIDRQRRLLDITWKPQGNTHTVDTPHQNIHKVEEAVYDDQQLCSQTMNSNPDEEQPESAHIKEEEEELLTGQEGKLLLKDETDNFLITETRGENYHNDTKLNGDRIPSYTSPADEHFHLEGSMVEDSGAARCADIRPEDSYQTNNVGEFSLLESLCPARQTAKKQYFCDTCGKIFLHPYHLKRHKSVHEKPYFCTTCGKTLKDKNNFTVHMKIHTGEKPFSCKICRKSFNKNNNLLCHIRTHTGEKSHSCQTCGKCFSHNSVMLRHMRTHTGEKPHSCQICGKSFHKKYNLSCHMRTHTGEKPYCCQICGKCFIQSSVLMRHMRSHTGEKL